MQMMAHCFKKQRLVLQIKNKQNLILKIFVQPLNIYIKIKQCTGILKQFFFIQGIIQYEQPENILLTKQGQAKLCDFGFAAILGQRKTLCGTYQYMSPEMIQNKPYDFKIDIWALGILLFQMISGQAPFRGQSPDEVLSQMKTKIYFCERFQSLEINLIKMILRVTPHKRPTVMQILEHQFFNESNGIELSIDLANSMPLYNTNSYNSNQSQKDLTQSQHYLNKKIPNVSISSHSNLKNNNKQKSTNLLSNNQNTSSASSFTYKNYPNSSANLNSPVQNNEAISLAKQINCPTPGSYQLFAKKTDKYAQNQHQNINTNSFSSHQNLNKNQSSNIPLKNQNNNFYQNSQNNYKQPQNSFPFYVPKMKYNSNLQPKGSTGSNESSSTNSNKFIMPQNNNYVNGSLGSKNNSNLNKMNFNNFNNNQQSNTNNGKGLMTAMNNLSLNNNKDQIIAKNKALLIATQKTDYLSPPKHVNENSDFPKLTKNQSSILSPKTTLNNAIFHGVQTNSTQSTQQSYSSKNINYHSASSNSNNLNNSMGYNFKNKFASIHGEQINIMNKLNNLNNVNNNQERQRDKDRQRQLQYQYYEHLNYQNENNSEHNSYQQNDFETISFMNQNMNMNKNLSKDFSKFNSPKGKLTANIIGTSNSNNNGMQTNLTSKTFMHPSTEKTNFNINRFS